MSPHLRQNLVAGLLYNEQVITDFRASLHWVGDRWGDSASYPCTAIHGVTRFGSSGLAEARLLLVVFQSLWICLVNPIPASTTSVSLFAPVLLAYLSPAIAPSTAACAVPPPLLPRRLPSLLNSCRSISRILETHAQELWPGQRDHPTASCRLNGDLSPDGPPLRRAESRPSHSSGFSTTLDLVFSVSP